MKRVLTFDGEKAPKRFELCRVALLSAGDGKGPRDRETTRKEARLLDALDRVSIVSATEQEPDRRILAPRVEGKPLCIELSADDHALLTKYLDSTPWLPRASRDAVDVQDWADSAEKID
jgi:hypothetical protein